MTQYSNQMTTIKQSRILLYYQCFLAVAAVFLFCTNLDSYLFDTGVAPKPVLVIYGFAAACIPLFSSFPSKIKYIPRSVVIAFSLYLAMSLISFILSPESEAVYEAVQARIRSVFFVMLMIFIISGDKLIENCVRLAMIAVIVMNLINNYNELLNPVIFGGLNDTGRPAGFYVNPNKASCALMLGMILNINFIPRKYRLLFILVCTISIMLTFSRGAMLIIPIVIFIFALYKLISRKQFICGLVVAVFFIHQFIGSSKYILYEAVNLGLQKNVITRIETFIDPSSSESDQDTSRVDVIPFAWQNFFEKPFFGHGIGYTSIWGDIPPHNMYLFLMVEHGFLGLIIFPLLVLSLIINARGEAKYISHAFAVYILLWGIFSHDILSERFALLPFSLMIVMNVRSQPELKLGIQKNFYS